MKKTETFENTLKIINNKTDLEFSKKFMEIARKNYLKQIDSIANFNEPKLIQHTEGTKLYPKKDN